MQLVSMKEILTDAFTNKYAVGQFNINNLEWVKSILKVAQENRSPAILGISGGTVSHMAGCKTIHDVVIGVGNYQKTDVPIVLHLDHGKTKQACIDAIDAGFSSVMFDGSHLPFEDNLKITKEIVEYAKRYNVSVEAELGTIAGSEDGIVNSKVIYADLTQCMIMAKETGIDCLAAALGSTHGLYKGKAKLGFKEMEIISKAINIPLVLHGGTGISDEDMLKAIELGTAKINVNTEFMYAWCQEIEHMVKAPDCQHDINDPRKVITQGLIPVEKLIARRMHLFGSINRY
ncbi:MAG: class II fructose-1,6-bisphosphate aldolase [[Pasteurella] mairii]|uniref:Fructose-1,6-bisphosphate aldolase n=1 Tax=[Pasteurella] mairii TaxID=757 RepID=A0A379B1K8_9PAST|nr:class II fructose-1,6-bisphosphate aldolase [[Pasteurella] mairii]SUB32477.1 fructose-1,6-bisphosphate aldolase [[Pasteurella] mairii]